MTDEPEAPAEETAEAAEPEPAPKSKGKAKAQPPPDPVAEHLEAASADGLSGVTLVMHELEVGFCHALAGAEDEAKAAMARAEQEIDRHAPHLSHLASAFALRKARIHAALKRK